MSFMSVRLSTCTSAVSAGRISTKFGIGDFYESLSKTQNLLKWDKKKNIGHLHEDPSVFHVGSNICSLKINRTHCYVSMAALSIFVILLTAKFMSSIYRESTVEFPFTRTLPTFFRLRTSMCVRWRIFSQ
jgi:hypothetical protein